MVAEIRERPITSVAGMIPLRVVMSFLQFF